MQKARQMIYDEIANSNSGFVLYVENYQQTDFVQLVNEYAFSYPNEVMKAPKVTANVYPQSGSTRVVELDFQYQKGKVALLYSFQMNRHTYDIQTTDTPAYSLLCHGVGDSRAFAMVYAAICRISGLDCQVVSRGSDVGIYLGLFGIRIKQAFAVKARACFLQKSVDKQKESAIIALVPRV